MTWLLFITLDHSARVKYTRLHAYQRLAPRVSSLLRDSAADTNKIFSGSQTRVLMKVNSHTIKSNVFSCYATESQSAETTDEADSVFCLRKKHQQQSTLLNVLELISSI